MPSKPCVVCGRSLPIFAGGTCHHCFALKVESEGLPPEQMPLRCPVDGCVGYVVKRGLCDRHYRRFLDHGTTEKLKVVSQEGRHREYKNWLHLKTIGALAPEWQNFWTFVEAIGERPGDRYRLRRPDRSLPYGPGNWSWTAPLLEQSYSQHSPGDRAAYQRERKALTPRNWVGNNLLRYYGMSVEQYHALLEQQGGHCALCDKDHDVGADGKPQLLAVDHDHVTGEVRGLLCRNHNLMLGKAEDSADALLAAAAYVERGASTGIIVPRVGDASPELRRAAPGTFTGATCSVEGCDHAVKAKGVCQTHYARLLRNGTLEPKRQPKQKCQNSSCHRPAIAHGLCPKHYEFRYRRGLLEQPLEQPLPPCTVAGCEEPVIARGYCQMHYQRWKRHGSASVIHDTHGRPIVAPSLLTCDAPQPEGLT